MVEIVAGKSEHLVSQQGRQLLSIVLVDCDYFFVSLWDKRDDVLTFDLNPFAVSPNSQILDSLSFLIMEGQLIADNCQLVLKEYLSFSDNGSAGYSLALDLHNKLA